MKILTTISLILLLFFTIGCSDDDESSGSGGNYVIDEKLPYVFEADTLHIYTQSGDTFKCYNALIPEDTLFIPAEMSDEEERAEEPAEIEYVMIFTRIGSGETIIGEWMFLEGGYRVLSGTLSEEEKLMMDAMFEEYAEFYLPGMMKLTIDESEITAWVKSGMGY